MNGSPKKLLIVNILDILRRYSDEEHRLSQKDISDILRKEYGMSAERKAIRRNLLNLMDCGFDIEYTESVRTVPNRKTGEPEDSYIWTDFYLVRDFTDGELRLLIDSLLFSRHIPRSQCLELVEKLEGLSSVYFRSRVKHILTAQDSAPVNPQLFYTIEVLDEAISRGRKITFHYSSYGTDKKPHLRRNGDGDVKDYVVSPYQMVASIGRYYLIACTDMHDNVSHYRLDRMTDVRLLDTPARPEREVEGLRHGMDLPNYMAEHVYLYSGESAPVSFRARKSVLNDVIDWFGTDVSFSDETEDEVTVRATVNLHAMHRWAVQYIPYVRVLTPSSLAEAVRRDVLEAAKQYR